MNPIIVYANSYLECAINHVPISAIEEAYAENPKVFEDLDVEDYEWRLREGTLCLRFRNGLLAGWLTREDMPYSHGDIAFGNLQSYIEYEELVISETEVIEAIDESIL